jgi:Glycosyl transferase family 11
MNYDKPLIIYTHGSGRLGNQLFSYAHFVAFLFENQGKYNFINFGFIPYSKLLRRTSENLCCTCPTEHNYFMALQYIAPIIEADLRYKIASNFQEKLIVNTARLIHSYGAMAPQGQSLIVNDIYNWSFIAGERIQSLDLALPETVDYFSNKLFTALAGWSIRSWSLLERHKHFVREALAFHPKYIDIAQSFINNLRQDYDFLIGVAVRQGDYRSSGEIYKRFLFEIDQYIHWIQQAKDVFSHKGRIGFVLTADEPQDPEKFNGLNVHFSTGIAGGRGHFVESLIELSLCNMVMASGTTFAAWSAFAGNIPFLPLHKLNQEIFAEDLLSYFEALKLFDSLGNKIL